MEKQKSKHESMPFISRNIYSKSSSKTKLLLSNYGKHRKEISIKPVKLLIEIAFIR